jgi:HK97 family phage major capsid protein
VEKAAEENRQMTPEEEGTWQRLMEELDKTDEKIGGVLTAEKRQKDTDDAFDALTRQPAGRRAPGLGAAYADSTGRDVNSELRAIARNEPGAPRHLEVRHNGPFGAEELRSMISTASGQSAVVPTDFYDRLIAHLIEVSGIMQAGPTLLNTDGGEALQIPKTLTHATATLTGQGANIPIVDPTESQVILNAFKYGVMTQVARELIDDSGVDLLGYLAMAAGRAVGNALGSDLILGNASSKPSGLIFNISGTPGVTGFAASAISAAGLSAQNITVGGPSYGNLVDLEYSVIAPYRQSRSCYWMLRDKSVAALRKLTDTQGRPVWEPSTVLGSPDLLLGKPVVADPYMPAMASGAGVFPLAFGDFSQFFVRLVGGVRFERSDDFAFGTDLVSFRCLIRGDGTLVDTNAVKSFQGGG